MSGSILYFLSKLKMIKMKLHISVGRFKKMVKVKIQLIGSSDAFKTEDEFRKCFESDDLSDLSDEEILKRFKKNRK